MSNSALSHLNQLLKEFHLTGKQLAEYLNVDYSLVSKWRSGKRRLNPEYIRKIAGLFITLDGKYEYQRIETLLHKKFTEKEKQREERMAAYLEFWLASRNPEEDKNSIESFMSKKAVKREYYMFSGEDGRREAVDTFLDYAASSSGNNLWLFSQEDNRWFSEDEEYQLRWQDKNFDVLSNDNTIHVIHPVDRRYRQVAQSMFRWLPIHLVGNALAYYIPKYWDPEIKITIFLAENLAVLIGVTSEKFTRKIQTYLFTDPEVLQNARDVLMELFHQSLRMFRRYGFESNGEFFSVFKQIVQNSNPVYYFSGAPILYMVSEKHLREALMENDYTEQEKKEYEFILYQCSFEYMRNVSSMPITYIIHEAQLRRLLKLNRVMMRFLSHCLGRPFYASQGIFRKLLVQALETMCAYDNFNILITDYSMLYPYEDIALFVKEKDVAGFVGTHYESEKGACALITEEPSVVASLFYSCTNFVKSHPHRNMTKPETRDYILGMIEESDRR